MHGRSDAKHLDEGIGVMARDRGRVERTKAVLDLRRAGEGGFHGNLLVEKHAEQQRERVVGEQGVGGEITGQVQHHAIYSATGCRGAPPGAASANGAPCFA